MIIGAIGIEIANLFYQHHNNLHFALYCNVVGLLFLIFIGLTFFTGTPKSLTFMMKQVVIYLTLKSSPHLHNPITLF